MRQTGPKCKTSADLLEKLHSRNLEDAECRAECLTIFNSKPKFGQIGLKSKISSDLLETLFTSQSLKVRITNLKHKYFNILSKI